MAVAVAPTLETMMAIYALSATGGERSERFMTYVEACRSGERLHGYNPMTSKPVASALQALLAVDAERIALEAGRETLERIGIDVPVTLFFSVATPGAWTDRQASAVTHSLAPIHPGEMLFWFDEEACRERVRTAAIEQSVRAVWWLRHRETAPTLSAVAGREGLAGFLADRRGAESDAAGEVVDVLGDDTSRGTAAAYLFGDHAARALGYPQLSLDEGEGLGHSIAQVARRCSLDSVVSVAAEILAQPEC